MKSFFIYFSAEGYRKLCRSNAERVTCVFGKWPNQVFQIRSDHYSSGTKTDSLLTYIESKTLLFWDQPQILFVKHFIYSNII